MDNPE